MATLIVYPKSDISLNHLTTGNNGYSVLNDNDDSTYIYQSVKSTDFVEITSRFLFNNFSFQNVNIDSVKAVVRMTATSNNGVNMARMTVSGAVTTQNYYSDPTYNNFVDCNFNLATGDLGLSSASITTAQNFNNIELSVTTRVKKTTSRKPNFEIHISAFYLVIEYTITGEQPSITPEHTEKVLVSYQYLADIANAIRTKNNSNTTYTLQEMVAAILEL